MVAGIRRPCIPIVDETIASRGSSQGATARIIALEKEWAAQTAQKAAHSFGTPIGHALGHQEQRLEQ
jgi:hypothetical protein